MHSLNQDLCEIMMCMVVFGTNLASSSCIARSLLHSFLEYLIMFGYSLPSMVKYCVMIVKLYLTVVPANQSTELY